MLGAGVVEEEEEAGVVVVVDKEDKEVLVDREDNEVPVEDTPKIAAANDGQLLQEPEIKKLGKTYRVWNRRAVACWRRINLNRGGR
jgi:hypothetical protein